MVQMNLINWKFNEIIFSEVQTLCGNSCLTTYGNRKKNIQKVCNKISADKIQSAYIEYLLTNGKRPVSVYKFCLDLGIKEDEFYQQVWIL